MTHAAGDGRDRPRHGPVPVRVVGEHDGGAADAARCRREGAVLRVAEDRDRRTRPRVDEPQRSRSCAVDAQHGDVVVRVVRDDLRVVQAGAVRELDAGAVLARDDVRRGDDEVGRREPAAALDADPARLAEDADDRRGRKANGGIGGDRRAHRCRRRRRPRDRRERVDPREQVQQPARRHDLVEPTHDVRLPHGLLERRLAGQEQRGGAEHPDEHEPGARAEQRPGGGVEEAERRQLQAVAQERAGEGSPLPGARARRQRLRRGPRSASTPRSRRRAAGAARRANPRTRRRRARRARAHWRSARGAARRAPRPRRLPVQPSPRSSATRRPVSQPGRRLPATLGAPWGRSSAG